MHTSEIKHPVILIGLHLQSEMNDDHLYRDLEYSLDKYIYPKGHKQA
jgi:hypothetical protein